MSYGYTLMTEQSGPRELVGHAAAAEAAGFDFEVISDHYFPWLDSMGHSAYAWSVLGAVTQVTAQIELMTCVTCPTMRYHPAVVAQKAATADILSDRRVTAEVSARRPSTPRRPPTRAAARPRGSRTRPP
jgi:G6PDH family F420-dependent oxidoreductase